jgi:hypothetical protein
MGTPGASPSSAGSGKPCDGCGERIAVGAPEFEVDFTHSVTLLFHQAEVLLATAETRLAITESLASSRAVRARAMRLRSEAAG